MLSGCKYKYTKLFLILLFAVSCSVIFAQDETGTPYFSNYPPKKYGYENQNFWVVHGPDGMVYFANTNGILEYDGHKWTLIPLQGIPRLASAADGNIYVSGFSSFGKLVKNEKNRTVFQSLLSPETQKYLADINIDKIVPSGKDVYVSTGRVIYRWDGKTIVPYDSAALYITCFDVNGKLYVSDFNKGLFLSDQAKRVTQPYTDVFRDKEVVSMVPYVNGQILAKARSDKGLYIINNKSYRRLFSPYDEFIDNNIFNVMEATPAGDIVIGTKKTGIIILSSKGELLSAINRHTGLWDDDIIQFSKGNAGNMWVAMNNGISQVEYPAGFSYYKYAEGIKGGVSSVIRFKGEIYIATTQGCFKLSKNVYTLDNHLHINYFQQLSNSGFECNVLFRVGSDELLVTSNTGLYRVEGNRLVKILDGRTEGIVRSAFEENRYYVGGEGLIMLTRKGNRWEYEKLDGLNYLVRTIAEDAEGNLWLGTDYLGIYQVLLHGRWNNVAEIKAYESGHGLPANYEWVDVYKTSRGVLFSTYMGIYRFNNVTGTFLLDKELGLDFSSGEKWVFPVVEDEYKNIWFSCATKGQYEKETGIAFYNSNHEKYTKVSAPFRKIKDFTVECIYPDTGAVAWFGGFDGLIRFDASVPAEDTIGFKTLIRSITIGSDSSVFTGNEFTTDSLTGEVSMIVPTFRYRYNHILFTFAAPFHTGQDEMEYQCFLEGFDKAWQPWDKSDYKDYSYLPEGSYVFHVRARNLFGNLSSEATYYFEIAPPLYRHWMAYLIYLSVLIAFIYMLLKWRAYVDAQDRIKLERLLAERTEELVKQKERAEELVANILPKDTAEELVSKGHATRKKYKMVTVLFSDVQGFTQIAEHMNPERLLDELDKFFLYFDAVVERLGIEKIKTIGDAYMCAGGIPVKNRTNPIDVVLAAIEIQQYMKVLKTQSQNEWDIRIGVHTGPVIAGVVGAKKYTFDIWGDTVNIASRMESTGQAGEINVSETTHEMVKDYFACEYRGKLPVKYKGEIDMYFIKGILPELSENGDGIHPNREFLSKLQLLRFNDLEELIMTKLDKGLPKNLYYHNVKHTIDVMVQTEILAISEKVTREEMLMLKTAALFHDTGFLIGYDDHEFLSIKMARDILPQYKYTSEQIEVVCELIFATKLPPAPKNKMEMIMCDADLDYLGRNDFIPVSQNLFREMYERGKIRSIEEWNRQQYAFINQHNYFTETARKLREINKMEILKELKKMIE